jgi:hypothetical protein
MKTITRATDCRSRLENPKSSLPMMWGVAILVSSILMWGITVAAASGAVPF